MENRGVASANAADRLDWVDVARGIGIVAVVLGHVWTRGPLRDAMYSFHMPLFFLLSGMLSHPQAALPFARRQFAGQMRPYAAFLLLLILADQIIEPLKGGRPIFRDWPQDVVPILLGGTWLRGPYTIFWFVPCLMVARIAFNMALARWPDPFDRRWALFLPPLLVLAYVAGWALPDSPWGLTAVPMGIVLLWVGLAASRIPWRGSMLGLLVPLALAGLGGMVPTLNMKIADYGWPLLSIGAAIATSLVIVHLSRRIAPRAAMLAALGRASLVIMYLHVALIHYLTPVLGGTMAGKLVLALIALLLPFAMDHMIRLSPRASRWLL